MIEIACHDAFAQQLKAAHLGFNKTAPVVAAPFLPDRPAQPARRVQNVVACIRTAAIRLPGCGILAGRDNGLRSAQSDGLVTVLGVVCAIAADAGNTLVSRNLAAQP